MTTEHATTALTNPKNFFLNGRKLVVEYASPEAVRRGGGGPRGEKGGERPARDRDTHTEGGAEGQQRRARVRPARKREPAEGEREDEPEKPVKRRKVEEAGVLGIQSARRCSTESVHRSPMSLGSLLQRHQPPILRIGRARQNQNRQTRLA